MLFEQSDHSPPRGGGLQGGGGDYKGGGDRFFVATGYVTLAGGGIGTLDLVYWVAAVCVPCGQTWSHRAESVGLGLTSRGLSLVYHAGTEVDWCVSECGSRGGMVSCRRSWHTPWRACYWCHATCLCNAAQYPGSTLRQSDSRIRRQDAWWRSSGIAHDHHLVT